MKKDLTNRKLKKTSWLFTIVLSLLLLCPSIGYANDEGTLNFYVTPELPKSQVDGSNSYFDLNLAAGEKETLSLTLQNATSEPIQVQVTPHTAYTNVHGVVEYGKDAENPDESLLYSLDELIEPSGVIDLEGNEIRTITLPLHMPDENIEGFLAGGLRVTEVKEEQEEIASDEEGVAIKNEFAYVVGVVISNSRDSVQPDLELLDVFADQLNYRNVISATIQNFTPTFVNRMTIEATVQREGEDDILYEANEEMMQMAPNSHFNFPISLEGDRFQGGEYVLKITATSGEEEWTWKRAFTIKTDVAQALNRQDVTIDTSNDWWKICTIALLIMLIAYILFNIKKNIPKEKMRNQE